MNGRVGWGGVGWRGGWKLGHEEEGRENKSPSEEDDASWLEKQQGILSLLLSLPFLIFVFLPSLSFFFFNAVISLRSAEI